MIRDYKKSVGKVPRVIDSAIGVVAPQWALNRKKARIASFLATYEGGKPGRYRQTASMQNLALQDANLNGLGRVRIMAEARDLEDNTGLVLGIQRMFAKYCVGKLRAQSLCSNRETAKIYEDYFAIWSKVADFSGRLSFTDIAMLAVMAMKRDGDIGFNKVQSKNFPFPQLQAIEADRIGSPYDYSVTKNYVAGIILNDDGKPVGYRIFNRGPAGVSFTMAGQIKAENFIHILDPLRFDQYRGVSAYAAAVNSLRDIKEILDYEKLGVKWASSQAAVIERQSGTIGSDVPLLDEINGDGNTDKIETFAAATVNYLAPGDVFKAFTADRPSQGLTNFIPLLVREIAIGLELPPGFVWDMAQLGGVPARFEAQLAKRTFQRIQWLLKEKLLDHCWSWIIADGIQKGQLPIDEDFNKVRWQFPAHPTVDVGRESKANLDENRQGMKTMAAICDEDGEDWDEVIEQLAIEESRRLEMAKEYGIDPNSLRQLGPNPPPTPVEEDVVEEPAKKSKPVKK